MTYRNKPESQLGIKWSGSCCVICGWNKKDQRGDLLVIGAHVRPFVNVVDYDKHDNIIALCPNHHIEFDSGNLTIDFDTKRCLHISNNDEYSNKVIVGSIDHIKPGFLDYHKKHVFNG